MSLKTIIGVISAIMMINAKLDYSNQLQNDESVSINLLVKEPYYYYFNDDNNYDLSIKLQQFGRFQFDEIPNFCQVIQQGYQYTTCPLLWANQKISKASVKQFSAPFVQNDIKNPTTALTDFEVQGLDTYIVTNTGRYQTFDQNNNQTNSVDILNENSQVFKFFRVLNTTILVTSKIIRLEQKGCVDFLILLGKDSIFKQIVDINVIKDVLIAQNMIFLACGRKGLQIYNMELVRLTKYEDYFKTKNITDPTRLSFLNETLYVLDHIIGLRTFNVSSTQVIQTISKQSTIPCRGCVAFAQIDQNTYVLATETNLTLYVNGQANQTVLVYGITHILQAQQALILTGPDGVHLIDDTSFIFGHNYLIPLSQQVIKARIYNDTDIYLLNSDSLLKLHLYKHYAYLKCLANTLEKADVTYSFQVLGSRELQTQGNQTYSYVFRIELVTPLITSSDIPMILGVVLGLTLFFIFAGIAGVYFYKKYQRDKGVVYQNIYKNQNEMEAKSDNNLGKSENKFQSQNQFKSGSELGKSDNQIDVKDD